MTCQIRCLHNLWGHRPSKWPDHENVLVFDLLQCCFRSISALANTRRWNQVQELCCGKIGVNIESGSKNRGTDKPREISIPDGFRSFQEPKEFVPVV